HALQQGTCTSCNDLLDHSINADLQRHRHVEPPGPLAVLKMTSSNLTGACTGRSAGFAHGLMSYGIDITDLYRRAGTPSSTMNSAPALPHLVAAPAMAK